MLNQSSDASIDIEKQKEFQFIQRQQSIEQSVQLPVREHMLKLENILNSLKKDLEYSKKDMSNLRMEIVTLKSQHQTTCDDIGSFVKNECNRQSVECKKRSLEVQQEQDFFDAQFVVVRQDKEKLDEIARILDLRTQQCEGDVGFRHVYD